MLPPVSVAKERRFCLAAGPRCGEPCSICLAADFTSRSGRTGLCRVRWCVCVCRDPVAVGRRGCAPFTIRLAWRRGLSYGHGHHHVFSTSCLTPNPEGRFVCSSGLLRERAITLERLKGKKCPEPSRSRATFMARLGSLPG